MSRLLDLAATVPWLITPEALEAMLAIAAREPLDSDDLKTRMHGPKSLALRDGSRRDDSGRMTMRDGVAVIPIDGPIFRYADMFTEMSGGVTTDALARDLQKALDDPAVQAILFAIDSPGGEATGINELADAIYAARMVKPIGAYVEGYGASAAYWLASAAGTVWADESALLGSIGTVMSVMDPTKRVRTTMEFVSSQSPKKRPDPTTQGGRAVLQALVDELTEVFIAKVMRNRGMARQDVLALEGGMLVGQAAITAGLADTIGSEEGAIRALREQARAVVTSTAGGTSPRASLPREETMKLSDMWRSFFQAAKAEGIEIEPEGDAKAIAPRHLGPGEQLASGPTPAGMTATPIATPTPDPQVVALTAEIEKLKAENRAREAQMWAQAEIGAGRALPAEREQMTALYVAAHATGNADVLSSLHAAYAARPAHVLTKEVLAIDPKGAGALSLDRTGDAAAKERAEAEAALEHTGLGRAAKAKLNGAAK